MCRYVERNPLRANLVRRAEDWRWGSLWRWLQAMEPEPALLSPWAIPQSPNWLEKVNEAMNEAESSAVRRSIQRGRAFGDDAWIMATAQRLDLTSTLRPRGRPRVRVEEAENKET